MRLKKYLLFCIIGTFNYWGLTLYAQDSTRPLILSEAIQASIQNNHAILINKLDESIAMSNYKQSEAIYLPQIDLHYTAFTTNNPLNVFGFKLQQKAIVQNDFNPSLLNHPNAMGDFTTQIAIQQPLINLDLWTQRKAASKQIELYQFKTQRTKEYLSFEVEKAFLQLQLAQDAVKVLKEARQTSNAVYSFTEDHYKQGLIQKSDLLNAKLQATTVETNLAQAKSNIATASDYLSLLMGKPTGIIYTIVNNENLATPFNDTALKVADTRSDFLAMQKAIEANNLMMAAARKSRLPKLNAFANYQLNDAKALGFGANSYLVGLELSWNIFKGNSTKNAIATQKLEGNKLSEQLQQQKDQGQLELNKAYRDLSDASFNVQQQQTAVVLAKESLVLLQNRYQLGLVNTTDILTAATTLSQKQFDLSQSIFNKQVTQAFIKYLTANNHQ